MNGLEDVLEKCFMFRSGDESYSIRPGMRTKVYKFASKLVEEETDFDQYKYRYSRQNIDNKFVVLLKEVKEKSEETDRDYAEILRELKVRKLRKTIGGDLQKFTITIPLNLIETDSFPNVLESVETDFHKIEEDKWRELFRKSKEQNEALKKIL